VEKDIKGKQDVAGLHQGLVEQLVRVGNIRTTAVEAAFRAVPRHVFLPELAAEEVYRDEAIATKFLNGSAISSSSQPAIMAIMLEQLELQPGQRVLEIGAGTGYNAALMAHIVGDTGRVVTVDLDDDTAERAREHLAAAGFDRVQVVCSDGGLGYADAAPYDRIILTVGARDIMPAWHEQLKPGGRLLLPLSIRDTQLSVAFEKVGDHLTSLSARAAGFMLLRGAFGESGIHTQPGPDPGLYLQFGERHRIDRGEVYRLVTGASQDFPTHVQVLSNEIFYNLSIWLALYEPDFCRLSVEGALVERGILPNLFHSFATNNTSFSTVGLLGETTVCLLVHHAAAGSSVGECGCWQVCELFVRKFGPDDALALRLIEQIHTWDKAGRPGDEKVRIRAYPYDSDYVPVGNEIVVQKRWTRLVISWDIYETM
jgi:protein-L-isoaspartate(D-aspartate) O-methyltransferase